MLKSLFSNPKRDIENLKREKPWIISKEWTDAIAAADGDKGRLQILYDCLVKAINEKPQKFDLWWLEAVPSDVESDFAAIGKSDRPTLHKSLLSMTSAEQEKVVKSILKFWHKRSPDQVPDTHKEYAGIKPEAVAPVTVEVVPYGAIAEPVAPLPKVEAIVKEIPDIEPNELVFTGDVIGEIAATDLHILIATKTGAGKSTTLKAVIHRIKQNNLLAEFAIIDPKTTCWLGLQRSTKCVTYLEQNTTAEQLNAALSSIENVFSKLQSRKNQKQQALKNGLEIPKFNSQYLIIDEWFSIYDSVKRQKREDAFMEPLNQIVAQGRELKVHLILVGQSHLCGEIGFSTAMRRSFAVLAQGRMGKNRDVGYEPIAATIEDPNMFRNKSDRESLMYCLKEAIAMAQKHGDRPVLLTTMGVPKIALLPDLKYIETVTM